jgi:hypothetical protein|tara:strand:+ start:122 stop:352 length:231 start_codon:yes stop_codon:yes gene_type:complete
MPKVKLWFWKFPILNFLLSKGKKAAWTIFWLGFLKVMVINNIIVWWTGTGYYFPIFRTVYLFFKEWWDLIFWKGVI